jgi:hypothetical protein
MTLNVSPGRPHFEDLGTAKPVRGSPQVKPRSTAQGEEAEREAITGGGYDAPVADLPSDREILERTVHAIAARVRDAYRVVEEAHEVEPRDESRLVGAAKRLRMELLQTKAELERELGNVLLHCRRCNRRVHWVSGVGPESGHWAHAEPSRTGTNPN